MRAGRANLVQLSIVKLISLLKGQQVRLGMSYGREVVITSGPDSEVRYRKLKTRQMKRSVGGD